MNNEILFIVLDILWKMFVGFCIGYTIRGLFF